VSKCFQNEALAFKFKAVRNIGFYSKYDFSRSTIAGILANC